MTAEEELNAAVQLAFTRYRNTVAEENDDFDDFRDHNRRLRNVREAVARLVGSVSEVNWLHINYMERN